MPEQIVEIVDRHGPRRRAKKGEVLVDGERFTLPMQFMDAAAREVADHDKYSEIARPPTQTELNDSWRRARELDLKFETATFERALMPSA
jgi:hypothetical protein